MTNREYCSKLYMEDLVVVNRVVQRMLLRECGARATLDRKESAYEQWLESACDLAEWDRARFQNASISAQKWA